MGDHLVVGVHCDGKFNCSFIFFVFFCNLFQFCSGNVNLCVTCTVIFIYENSVIVVLFI